MGNLIFLQRAKVEHNVIALRKNKQFLGISVGEIKMEALTKFPNIIVSIFPRSKVSFLYIKTPVKETTKFNLNHPIF